MRRLVLGPTAVIGLLLVMTVARAVTTNVPGYSAIPTPIAFSETPVDATRPEPALSEHTGELLVGMNLTDEELDQLRAANLI